MANKLIKKIEIAGSIKLLTGMHIGGTNSSMSIGGIDKAVIRNPMNNQPFIPGSSLKGKLRSLLEISLGSNLQRVANQIPNGPSSEGAASNLFGNATGNANTQKPSRILVRDCIMLDPDEVLKKTDIPYTEGKTEVVIDRITSAAMPRQNERVPAGVAFTLNLIINIWEQDNNEHELMSNVFKSLELLSDDYIGGHGSRGYGQIGFNIKSIEEKSVSDYYGKADAKPTSIIHKYQSEVDKLNSKNEIYADRSDSIAV